jgi:hypothetical protein
MVVLQQMDFGYQIDPTGADIMDLAAFVASDHQRAVFAESDVPDEYCGWTVDRAIIAFGYSATKDTKDSPTGNIARGYLLAERWCTDCHFVSPADYGGVAGPHSTPSPDARALQMARSAIGSLRPMSKCRNS